MVFDHNPGSFTHLNTYNTPDYARSVWGDGNYIYVADNTGGGIRAYSFDGTTFTLVSSYATPTSAQDIWGQGGYIYVAEDSGGLRCSSHYD